MSGLGTMGVVANLFGLGPMMEAVQSPDFQEHIRGIVNAILATDQRCERIEHKLDRIDHKLDLLCRAWGIEPNDGIVAEYLPRNAVVPATHGSDGTGRPAAASGVADDGIAAAAGSPELAAALASYAESAGIEFDLEAWAKSQAGPP